MFVYSARHEDHGVEGQSLGVADFGCTDFS